MCRVVLFTGSCTRCGEWQTWTDLSQELSCLEAKNNGIFGDCKRGVDVEEHGFEQECDGCVDDEGVSGLNEASGQGGEARGGEGKEGKGSSGDQDEHQKKKQRTS